MNKLFYFESVDRKLSLVRRGELDSCFRNKGVHGGNMAATDPPESPPKRPKSPSEEAEPSGPGKEAACTDGEATPKAPQSLGGERTEATAGSGDGRDGAAGRSPEDAGKTTDTPGDDGWGFDWSETEEEGTQPRGERRENDSKRPPQNWICEWSGSKGHGV